RLVEHAPGLVAGQSLVAVRGHVERVPPDGHRRGLLRLPEAQEEVREADERAGRPAGRALDRFRERVVRPVGEGIAVDREEKIGPGRTWHRGRVSRTPTPRLQWRTKKMPSTGKSGRKNGDRGRRLVIVESPAKAKTIAGYLGNDFMVESSVGHIRDLPHSAAAIPEEYKGEPWARLGVDVERDFEPLYVVDPDKKKKVSELRKLLAGSDELLLATDEDREGEAIAWHLLQVLKPKVPARRMVFHEITRDAIERALEQTRDVDQRL